MHVCIYILVYVIILYYIIWYCMICYYIILHYIKEYYIIYHYISLYYIILYFIKLYYTILYYIILYYIVLNNIYIYTYTYVFTPPIWNRQNSREQREIRSTRNDVILPSGITHKPLPLNGKLVPQHRRCVICALALIQTSCVGAVNHDSTVRKW